jgi:hypothetical protein
MLGLFIVVGLWRDTEKDLVLMLMHAFWLEGVFGEFWGKMKCLDTCEFCRIMWWVLWFWIDLRCWKTEGEIKVVVGLWHVTKSGAWMKERDKHLVRFACCFMRERERKWGRRASDFSEIMNVNECSLHVSLVVVKWVEQWLTCFLMKCQSNGEVSHKREGDWNSYFN